MAFKVSDEFRENPLSLRPGGYTVFVEEENGRILEYDKIKRPWSYINAVRRENPLIVKAWWK